MMKRRQIITRLLVFLSLLILVGCSSENNDGTFVRRETEFDMAAPSVTGALRVEGTHLTDSSGSPIQLRGVSTHGLAWFPQYVNEACFRQLRTEWGANVVRLAMYTEEYGGYCSGGDPTALKALIDNGVSYATAQDLYVIIDWHVLSDQNPNRHLAEAKAFFAEMSKRYASHNNVLYEICNEPNGGTSWNEIKSYAEQVIGVIRENDANAVILVGTPNWSQQVDQAAADPITQYDNIMYTLHFYAATHTDWLRNTMTAAIQKGLPIFVSEYGICDASGNGAIDTAQADQWVETMDQYGVSYVAWSLANKNETASILRSDCQKVSGFTESDLSDTGIWLYHMLTEKKGANLPAVPSRPAAPSKPDPGAGTAAGGIEIPQDNGLVCIVKLQNQWEDGGEAFFQYSLTIENRSGQDCGEWCVSVPFTGTVTLADGWNGIYTVSGSTLTVASKEYNGRIAAGGSANNIGVIVRGSRGLGLAL